MKPIIWRSVRAGCPAPEGRRIPQRAPGAAEYPVPGRPDRPRVSGAGAADQFAPEDLDAFLARLLDGALPTKVAGAGQVNIPDAAKQACCGSVEIVRLLLDRKLSRKWRSALAARCTCAHPASLTGLPGQGFSSGCDLDGRPLPHIASAASENLGIYARWRPRRGPGRRRPCMVIARSANGRFCWIFLGAGGCRDQGTCFARHSALPHPECYWTTSRR